MKIKNLFLSTLTVSLMLTGCTNSDKEKKESKQEGIEVEGSVISWANMKIDDKSLELTEQQKEILKYYDVDYLKIDSYENLKRYPNVFKGAQLNFYGHILKDIKSDDKTYQMLFEVNATTMNPDEYQENYVVIEGNQKEPRFVENDNLLIYGRYKEIKDYEIDGKKYSLPTISVNKFEEITSIYSQYANDYVDVTNNYTNDSITNVATAIFGEGTRTIPRDEDNEFNYRLPETLNEPYCYIEPGRQLNGNPKFMIGLRHPNIVFSDSNRNYTKEIYIMPDFENFMGVSYELSSKKLFFDYYDNQFNKKWSKDFENVNNYAFDYTTKEMYLVVNNDIHIINLGDGKELTNPITVGEKIKVNITKDGVFLIGKGKNDNISKIDMKGQFLWKTSIDFDIINCNMLQVIDDHIVLSLKESSNANKIVSVSSDGKILQEFWNEGVS